MSDSLEQSLLQDQAEYRREESAFARKAAREVRRKGFLGIVSGMLLLGIGIDLMFFLTDPTGIYVSSDQFILGGLFSVVGLGALAWSIGGLGEGVWLYFRRSRGEYFLSLKASGTSAYPSLQLLRSPDIPTRQAFHAEEKFETEDDRAERQRSDFD